jgi:hypothetical protein
MSVIKVATVDEAVNCIIENMSVSDILELSKHENVDELYQYHMTIGMQIRNVFGLWEDDNELLADTGKENADDASFVIITKLWERCRVLALEEGKTKLGK